MAHYFTPDGRLVEFEAQIKEDGNIRPKNYSDFVDSTISKEDDLRTTEKKKQYSENENSFWNYSSNHVFLTSTEQHKEEFSVPSFSLDDTFEIPYGTKIIHSKAFSYCRFKEIFIPDTVIEIMDSAFDGCSCLTTLNIPKSVKKIGNRAFSWCRSLTHIEIPNSVKEIGSSTFNGCSGLTSIIIPESVKKIGDRAFYQCESLTYIKIPNSVKEIGTNAFEGCKQLKQIKLSENLNAISAYCFKGCI